MNVAVANPIIRMLHIVVILHLEEYMRCKGRVPRDRKRSYSVVSSIEAEIMELSMDISIKSLFYDIP